MFTKTTRVWLLTHGHLSPSSLPPLPPFQPPAPPVFRLLLTQDLSRTRATLRRGSPPRVDASPPQFSDPGKKGGTLFLEDHFSSHQRKSWKKGATEQLSHSKGDWPGFPSLARSLVSARLLRARDRWRLVQDLLRHGAPQRRQVRDGQVLNFERGTTIPSFFSR